MEYVIGIILLALLMGGFIGSAFTAGQQPKLAGGDGSQALPPPGTASETPSETPPAPEPPRPPTFWERLRAVGVRTASLEELGMGPDEYVIRTDEKRKYAYLFRPTPDMLGWIVALDTHYAMGLPYDASGARHERVICAHCREEKTMLRIYRIAKRAVPDGARDLGLVETRRTCDICKGCGLVNGWPSAKDPDLFDGLYVEHPNFLDLLTQLEKRGGRQALETRLRLLKAERDGLTPRVDALDREIRRLEAELPHPDLDPFRGTPLAKLDDPPDDRAKAMPALSDDGTPRGE